eukprot:4698914-Alexandrium_andersonii.AAC.1
MGSSEAVAASRRRQRAACVHAQLNRVCRALNSLWTARPGDGLGARAECHSPPSALQVEARRRLG